MVITLCLISLFSTRLVAAESSVLPAGVRFDAAYEQLKQSDTARDTGNISEALKLYTATLEKYQELHKRYPDWKTAVIQFRIEYCNDQIESIENQIEKSHSSIIDDNKKIQNSSQSVDAKKLQAIKNSALVLLKNDKALEARRLLMEGLTMAPDDIGIRVLTGVAQCQAGQFKDAVFLLEEVISDYPDSDEAHIALASAYFGLNRIADATEMLITALKINNNSLDANYDLVHVFLAENPPNLNQASFYYKQYLLLGGKKDVDMDRLIESSPK